MTVPATKSAAAGEIMESVIVKGDLAKLTPDERVKYYGEVCRSMGLNPLTKPFEFITLNGKLQLYALRACTDQLRKINGISLEIVSRDIADDILTVHVRAKDNSGRADEDLGAVSFPPNLKGEARANAELKAVTKAKRRATLSICGLGWLDETEVEDIPASAKRPAPPAPNVMLPMHDAMTGEIIDEPTLAPTKGKAAPETPAAPVGAEHSAGTAAGTNSDWEDYVERWNAILDDATDAKELGAMWNGAAQKQARSDLNPPQPALQALMTRVGNKIAELKGTVQA